MQNFTFRSTRIWERSLCAMFCGVGGAFAADPWADRIVSYDPGIVGVGPYLDASVSVGSPERFTEEGNYPSAVTMFSPAFGTNEIVQIHPGGELVVAFDEPIVDDQSHPYGVDFSIFGYGGFGDEAFPNGVIDRDGLMFGTSAMQVSVSADGSIFQPLGIFTAGLFPAQGYLDVPPFGDQPGTIPTDFTVPMNPALTISDFAGLNYAQALSLYGNSGGGTPIDISLSGLASVQFVKIQAALGSDLPVTIDAFATIPEPGTATILAFSGAVLALGRPRLRRSRI